MKTCTKCKTAKALGEFARRSVARGGTPSWCKECTRACARADYYANKEHYYRKNKDRQVVIDNMVNTAKQRPCADCGVSYPPYVMDLDHRDPAQKDVKLSEMRKRNYGLARIATEIEKCDVVCANCHRERTSGPQGLNPARYLRTGAF